MNEFNICCTCGTQLSEAQPLPEFCPICSDDRQYISAQGQRWTNLAQLKKSYSNKISKINERLYTLKTEPDFAIAQRAFLLLSANGNVLWDCIPLLDEPTIDFIKSKGGLQAIVFSHPHYYSTMNAWASAFDCPVYIHRNDQPYVFNKGEAIRLWEGDVHPLWDDISIVKIGGHFPGSCLLHVDSLSAGGAILCGDSLYISRSKRHIAVMYSYPNQIMLSKKEFAAVHKNCSGLSFDTLYGAFEGQNLEGNAYDVFTASMKRYIASYEI
jgi:hypothetical protein